VQFTDLAGNQGHTLATITHIDTTQPHALAIMYSPSTTTNGNVTATLITDKPVTVLNSGRVAFDANGVVIATPYEATGVAISRQYEFTDNTTETIDFTDLAGNTGDTTVNITRIDRTSPTPTITYTPSTATNQNVVASLTFDKPHVTVTNNSGNTHYLFT
jgi:hypothetical protein